MTIKKLQYVSSTVVEELYSNVEENIERYKNGDFSDLSKNSGWSIEADGVRIDTSFPRQLEPSNKPDTEVKNSLLVYEGLPGMTPALAREERVWVRLCHMECADYCRQRWIGKTAPVRDVRNHYFANTLSRARDDNAIGRLWWNGYLAKLLNPAKPKAVLAQILKRANIRLQFVDRSNASFRLPLARGIVRALDTHSWLDSHDRAFEHFMLVLDKQSGGLLFEASSDAEIDQFLNENIAAAKKLHAERLTL